MEELQHVQMPEQVSQVITWQEKVVFVKSMGWESEMLNCILLPSPGFVTEVCGPEVEIRRSDVEFLDERGHLNQTLVDYNSWRFTLPKVEAAFVKG